jgi:hypothetical protein
LSLLPICGQYIDQHIFRFFGVIIIHHGRYDLEIVGLIKQQ